MQLRNKTVVLQDIPGILNVKHIAEKQNLPVIKTGLHEQHTQSQLLAQSDVHVRHIRRHNDLY